LLQRLTQLNIPEAGLLVILGVDTFLDIGTFSYECLSGNSIASAVVCEMGRGSFIG
jgi:Na+/H+-dicarboxylate symporter